MQVCIKKRRFIRLFFGDERERDGGDQGEKGTNHRGPLSIQIEFSKPSRNQNERHSRPSCLSSLRLRTIPSVVQFFFPSKTKTVRKQRDLRARMYGTCPAFVSFYSRYPSDYRRSNDDFVNDVNLFFVG